MSATTFREEVLRSIEAKQNTDRVAAELHEIATEIEAKHSGQKEDLNYNFWEEDNSSIDEILVDLRGRSNRLIEKLDEILAMYPLL